MIKRNRRWQKMARGLFDFCASGDDWSQIIIIWFNDHLDFRCLSLINMRILTLHVQKSVVSLTDDVFDCFIDKQPIMWKRLVLWWCTDEFVLVTSSQRPTNVHRLGFEKKKILFGYISSQHKFIHKLRCTCQKKKIWIF